MEMKQEVKIILQNFEDVHPYLKNCRESMCLAFTEMKRCYDNKGKILICGNGGSAADSEHIVGELMKGFILKRTLSEKEISKVRDAFPDEWPYLSKNLQGALPAISLASQCAFSTAYINDVAGDMVYAQQVYGYGRKDDILIAMSTSGNAVNVLNAAKIAKAFGLAVIGFTGEGGEKLKELCDVCIKAPSNQTYRIQEMHLPIYHALCAMIEVEYFN